MANRLSERERRFVHAFIGEAAGNATKAAELAGYSAKSASRIGHRLSIRVKVREAIDLAQQRLSERTGVTAERVIKELATIAFSDIRALFTDDGKLRDVHELPEDVARAVASVEISKERTRKDGDVLTEKWVSKLKTWDKPKALEMLGRHLALWRDSGDSGRITVNIGFMTSGQPAIDITSQVLPRRPHNTSRGDSEDG